MKKIFWLAFLFLAACRLSQDPISEKLQDVKSAKAPVAETKPEGIDSNVLRIDSPNFVVGIEGDELTIKLNARVSMVGYLEPEISIDNISEFIGATFVNKTFKWKPKQGVTKEDFVKDLFLKASAVSKHSLGTGPALKVSQEVNLRIKKAPFQPIIKKHDIDQSINVDSSSWLTVYVEDMDGMDDSSTWPQLLLSSPKLNQNAEVNLAEFALFDKVEKSAANEWRFSYRVDLKKLTVLGETLQGGLSLTAMSRFGKKSTPTEVMVQVQNNALSSTWPTSHTFQVGSLSEINFTVRAGGIGVLRLTQTTDVPNSSNLNCTAVGLAPVLDCMFQWSPQATDASKILKMVLDFQKINGSTVNNYRQYYFLKVN